MPSASYCALLSADPPELATIDRKRSVDTKILNEAAESKLASEFRSWGLPRGWNPQGLQETDDASTTGKPAGSRRESA